LRDSQYCVVGRIIPDRALALAWLRGDRVGEK
jgi:hypothetical protein